MNPSTLLARAILDRLVAGGVRHVVLSPGSRSAPLAFAAARLAEARLIKLHVRLDERSAAYLALGLAKPFGQPVAMISTSGTAVANLTPAVVEASFSGIPLVVVTADRPLEARGVGAPQTIDQFEFFSSDVRFFADLDAAGEDATTARACVRAALAAARRGPVHLNVGFRLPLVPDLADLEPLADTSSPVSRVEERTGGASGRAPAVAPEVTRGALVVGDLPGPPASPTHRDLVRLAVARGWPIFAEPSANLHGQANVLGHAVLVLGSSAAARQPPELVLTAGQFGLSRPTLELLRRTRQHVAIDVADAGREVCDPARTAVEVLDGVPAPESTIQPDPAWLAGWQAADRAVSDVVERLVDEGPRLSGAGLSGAGLSGAVTAREVWRSLPDDGLLLAAASWPVRHLEAFAGARRGVQVLGNRGANGIDGLIATAWGAALAHQERGGGQAVALLGDLAFLHDHNGLLAGEGDDRPDLTIVVVDNGGGGIFAQLEQGRPEYADQFARLFATPQRVDLVSVARALNIPALRVETRGQLHDELSRGGGGVRVVVVSVPGFQPDLELMSQVIAELSR